MARELGMNPKKLDNHDQEPWKLPLPAFIEHLYVKRFGRERSDIVRSIEERVRSDQQKKAARREAKGFRSGPNQEGDGGESE
jgi:phage regulator Rha-like protein